MVHLGVTRKDGIIASGAQKVKIDKKRGKNVEALFKIYGCFAKFFFAWYLL
jgi:hypothetical protein